MAATKAAKSAFRELYEVKHPEAKHGAAGGKERRTKTGVANFATPVSKPADRFTTEVSKKTNRPERRTEIDVAKFATSNRPVRADPAPQNGIVANFATIPCQPSASRPKSPRRPVTQSAGQICVAPYGCADDYM